MHSLPNPHHGEVSALIGGQPVILRLSLGALAALEASLDPPSLLALAMRFEEGQPRLTDALAIIGAALPGGPQPAAQVAALGVAGGAAGAYQLAARLLATAFGTETISP